VLQLAIAGIIWGLSFTCVKWALTDFNTSQLLFWRFLAAFVLGEGVLFLFFRERWSSSHTDIMRAFKPGLFLGLSLVFQIHGLNFTTATNSGFITSLYVVIIPFVSVIGFGQRLQRIHFFLAALAFFGMGLLVDLQLLGMNKGDWLTLGAAITAAFQIIYIGQTAPQAINAFRYNNYQTFWCFLALIPFLIFELPNLPQDLVPKSPSLLALTGLALLVVFVSILAFYLQVRAQKVLSTTTASMLCLLEGPFSFLFAALILGERLQALQALGAFFILLSSALSIYIDRPRHS
jgi:drug/metabolite transporter (DMT)-like permease